MGFFQNSGMGNDVFNVSFQKGVEFRWNSAYMLFNGCTNFNAPVKIPEYADDCGWMFNGCTNFNSNVYIDPYNSLCTRVAGMFHNCYNFNKNFNIPLLAHDGYECVPNNYNATIHVYSQGYDYAYNGNTGNFRFFFSQTGGNFNVVFHDTEPIDIGYMFCECNELNTNINIPVSVRDEHNAFEYCSNLNKNIRLHDRTNAYGCFHGCYNLNQNIKIPRLGDISSMFSTCYNLNQPMYVPEVNGETWQEQRNNVSFIFSSCTNLNSMITIDSNLKSMCGMFSYCSNFNQRITIPSNVVDITSAFEYCPNLMQTIDVPSSVRYMDFAFKGCYNLSVFPGVPSGVQTLDHTFSGTNITHITALPSSLLTMQYTFEACRSLNGVISIPSSVTSMYATFKSCTNFNTRVIIPSGVESLGSCFAWCNNLDVEITIPENTQVVHHIFEGCSKYSYPVTVGPNATAVYNCCARTKIPTFTHMGNDFRSGDFHNLINIRCNEFKEMVAGKPENSTVFNLRINANAYTHDGYHGIDALKSFFGTAWYGMHIAGINNYNRMPHSYDDYTQNFHDGFGACSASFMNDSDHMYMWYLDYPNATSEHTPSYYINLYFV